MLNTGHLKIEHDINNPQLPALPSPCPTVFPTCSGECGRPLKASPWSTHQTWPEEGILFPSSLLTLCSFGMGMAWHFSFFPKVYCRPPTGSKATSPPSSRPTVSSHPQPHALFVWLCNQLQTHSAPNTEHCEDDNSCQHHRASNVHANPARRSALST